MSCLRIIIVVLGVVLVGVGCTRRQSDTDRTGELALSGEVKLRRLKDLDERHFGVKSEFSSNQSNKLTAINAKLACALADCDVEFLHTCVLVLTNDFRDVRSWHRPPFEDVLDKYFRDEILRVGQLEVESTIEDMERRLAVDFEVAILLGQSRIRSNPRENRASVIDEWFYNRLKQCKSHFRSSGQQSCEKTIEKWTLRWIEYVESDVGVSRCAAHRIFDFEKERIVEVGDTTMGLALKAARAYANGLISSGYTPRWLDHDFPLPAKTTTGKEEESSSKTNGHTHSVQN